MRRKLREPWPQAYALNGCGSPELLAPAPSEMPGISKGPGFQASHSQESQRSFWPRQPIQFRSPSARTSAANFAFTTVRDDVPRNSIAGTWWNTLR